MNKYIMPEEGSPSLAKFFDIGVFITLALLERTENQWRDLLGIAKLVAEGLYQPPGGKPGIIVNTL
ncbi:hypothetical protein F5X99DRAFT_374549, partial [Biscogniauxia marginata]